MAAMTAISLDHLSGGRFIVGIGPSGPQVVEGWYGASYYKPLTRQARIHRDQRDGLRAQSASPEYSGVHYQLPYRGPGRVPASANRCKRAFFHCDQRHPIYTEGELAAEGKTIAEGMSGGSWLGLNDFSRRG